MGGWHTASWSLPRQGMATEHEAKGAIRYGDLLHPPFLNTLSRRLSYGLIVRIASFPSQRCLLDALHYGRDIQLDLCRLCRSFAVRWWGLGGLGRVHRVQHLACRLVAPLTVLAAPRREIRSCRLAARRNEQEDQHGKAVEGGTRQGWNSQRRVDLEAQRIRIHPKTRHRVCGWRMPGSIRTSIRHASISATQLAGLDAGNGAGQDLDDSVIASRPCHDG